MLVTAVPEVARRVLETLTSSRLQVLRGGSNAQMLQVGCYRRASYEHSLVATRLQR